MSFNGKIEAARTAGLLKACMEVLRELGRSAYWYDGKSEQIDASTFTGLRRQIDEAEALWRASRPKAKLEAV